MGSRVNEIVRHGKVYKSLAVLSKVHWRLLHVLTERPVSDLQVVQAPGAVLALQEEGLETELDSVIFLRHQNPHAAVFVLVLVRIQW